MAKILKLEDTNVCLVTRSELLDKGYTRGKIAHLLRKGELVRICNGVYLDPPVEVNYRESTHLLGCAGFMLSARRDWALSHWSAALMHGLPGWKLPLATTAVTMDSPTPRSMKGPTSYQRMTSLPADDVTIIAGFKVTGIERTLLDVGTTCGFAAAVVAIESALYKQLVRKHVLVEYFGSKRNLNNLPAGLKALAFASVLSESVLESRSRLFFEHFGIVQPEQQVLIHTRSGRKYRVDFLWRALKLIGEADGKAKIVGAGTTREQEKRLREHWRREEDLRAEGYTVVRWTWDDLANPHELRTRLESAFAQARRVAA